MLIEKVRMEAAVADGNNPGLVYRIQSKDKDNSVSVLVPGPPLRERRCSDGILDNLKVWFAVVECLAWECVNARYGPNRPRKIFLVTGQLLANRYAISYKENIGEGCEIRVKGDMDLEALQDSDLSVGSIEVVSGFQTIREDDNTLYSIFLQLVESEPMRKFERGKLGSRIENTFKYILFPETCLMNYRRFKKMRSRLENLISMTYIKWPQRDKSVVRR